MNYFNLIKLAAPQDKIRKYNITDNYQMAFIHKFEKDIDWTHFDKLYRQNENGVGTLNQFIDDKINNLIDEVDEENPNNSFFFKAEEIDVEQEIRENANHPQIQQAIQIYKRDPEGAKKQIADIINKTKNDVINSWLEYVMEENDVYKDNSAFQFLILSDIFKGSRKPSKNAPLGLNAEILAGVYSNIKGDSNVNLAKIYEKQLKNNYLQTSETVATKENEGWIRIPSKENDRENYQSNEAKLRDLSQGTGWCTGRGMEKSYLPQGDFWLLIENGKAVVAIRFVKNRVVEIQGRFNQRPYKYFAQIEKLFDEKNFDKESKHYEELLEVKKNNEAFENDDKEATAKFTEELYGNPSLLNRLDPKYYTDDVKQVCIRGYLRIIEKSKDALMQHGYIRTDVQYLNNVPTFVEENVEFQNKMLEFAQLVVQQDPTEYVSFPNSIQENAEFKESLLLGYKNKVEEYPWGYKLAPDFVQKNDDVKKSLLIGFKKSILERFGAMAFTQSERSYLHDQDYNPDAVRLEQTIPDFAVADMKKDANFMQQLIQESVALLESGKPERIHDIPQFVRNEPLVQNALVYSYSVKLKQDPRIEALEDPIPENIINLKKIQDAMAQGFSKDIEYNVDNYDEILQNYPTFANKPIIRKAFWRGWLKKIRNDLHSYNDAPQIVKDNNYLKKYLLSRYKGLLTYEHLSAESFVHNYENMPEFVKIALKDLLPELYSKHLKADPHNVYRILPQEIINTQQMQEERIQAWLRVLQKHVLYWYEKIPEDLKNRQDIQNAMKEGFVIEIKNQPKLYDTHLSPKFKKLPEIQKAYIEGCANSEFHLQNSTFRYSVPEEVQESSLFRNLLLQKYIAEPRKAAEQTYGTTPLFVRQNKEFQDALHAYIVHVINNRPGNFAYFKDLSVITNREYQEAVYKFYLQDIIQVPYRYTPFTDSYQKPEFFKRFPAYLTRLVTDLKNNQKYEYFKPYLQQYESTQPTAKETQANGWFQMCKLAQLILR